MLFRATRNARLLRNHWRFLSSGPASPMTPDFNTTVETHTHSRKAPKQADFMSDLKERTQGSLIETTLAEMEQDEDFKTTAKKLRDMGQKKLTLEEKKKRRRALDELGVPSFDSFLADANVALKRVPTTVFQINIGLYCNQACTHCHVESSPKRTEMMTRETAERCVEVIRNSPSITTVDLTGGAPELNDSFRYVVREARAMGKDVIDRCNLTVLSEPGQEDLADFLAEHKVHVVASLPCYSASNVNMQRGRGVFDKSIAALQTLNEKGYGTNPDLVLDLVYNPVGGFLPPAQEALQAQYKKELAEEFGLVFNSLFTITNMPIKRFADFLHRQGELQNYMELLVRNFNPAAVEGVMCNNHLNVMWDGSLYDCDFNQQLDLPLFSQQTIFDIQSTDDFQDQKIATDSHCFGCTAGAGSSCQGATL